MGNSQGKNIMNTDNKAKCNKYQKSIFYPVSDDRYMAAICHGYNCHLSNKLRIAVILLIKYIIYWAVRICQNLLRIHIRACTTHSHNQLNGRRFYDIWATPKLYIPWVVYICRWFSYTARKRILLHLFHLLFFLLNTMIYCD
jgi:hypothetical protein